ncbi:hypothetical protein PMAYCL1PPCAC_27187, partial [Pristionchus mayeri]
LSTVHTNLRDESAFMTAYPTDLSETPSSSTIESLPWPALNRVFFFLFPNDGNCRDLANLSKVSTHFHLE